MDVKNAEVVLAEPLIDALEDSGGGSDFNANVVERQTLTTELVHAMYTLYAEHYADTVEATFVKDLQRKTHVLLLRDSAGGLCGFSTLELYDASFSGDRIRVVFSGDTIIDPRHWGNNALAFEWLRFVGRVQRQEPLIPLYWLLIVKGHRTYRYLSTFGLRYTPHHSQAPCEIQTELLNNLASEKFGACFDATTGIARFGPKSGRLNARLAKIPPAHAKRAAVGYFLERNPGYMHGDELVCLCELSEDNMRPLAKRVFLAH